MKVPQVFNGNAPVESIAYCGGGKDSLCSLKLLENARVLFSSFSYSMSQYGSAHDQHKRTQKVLQRCKPTERHWVTISDTFLDVPLSDDQWLKKLGVIKRSEAFYTEMFSILPVMLHFGYRNAVIANERSANVGNLVWADEGGKIINHRWGKSYEAEQLISRYISQFLIEDSHFYNILKPIHDVVIFTLLRQHLDCIPFVQSCNISPPWCKRCPKCCYVWLSFQAYLPQHVVDPMFNHENLFDAEENQIFFKQMLGLGNQKPFECVGEFKEVQLAFEMCRRKGLHGRAMELFEKEIGPSLNVSPIVKNYAIIHKEEHRIPDDIAGRIIAAMESAAARIKAELQ